MRLSKFLEGNAEIYKDKTKLVILWGGTDALRTYALRLVEKWFESENKVVYFLRDVEDSLWELMSYLPYDLQVVFWEKNSLSDDEIASLLRQLGRVKHKTILIDPTEQLTELYRRTDVPKSELRRQIDCDISLSGVEVTRADNLFYERWLKLQEGVDVSPKLIKHLKERPDSDTVNIMKVMRWVGETNLNLLTAHKWGVLWSNEEDLFIDGLMNKGRGYVMRYFSWQSLSPPKVLWGLFRRVNVLMKIKTLQTGYLQEKTAKLDVTRPQYYAFKDQASRHNMEWFYKRLYLLSSLLKWRNREGVLNLLMLYW